MEDRSDGRKAGYGLGENLPENGICVIHLSRTFKELLMKIVKASLIALSVAAAGSVFAGAAIAPDGLEKVNKNDWDIDAALATQPMKSQDIFHFRAGIQIEDVYVVKTFQKSAHMSMVTEMVTRPEAKDVAVFVDPAKKAAWEYRKAK